MIYPNQKDFLKLSAKGNLIPVYREILGDLDTPVSAYFKVAQKSKYSFLLESVEGEEKVARFSFLATDPELILKTKNKKAEIIHFKNGRYTKKIKKIHGSPLEIIREIMSQYKFVQTPHLPRFCGGMVGYIGYDVVRFFEHLPKKPKDDLKLDDCILVLAKNLIIFDHLSHKMKIVSCIHLNPKSSKEIKIKEYKKGIKHIDSLIYKLNQALFIKKPKQCSGDKECCK